MTSSPVRVGVSGLPLGNRSGTGQFTEQLLRVLSEAGDSDFELSLLDSHPGKTGTPRQIRSFPVSSLHLRWPFPFLADSLLGKKVRDLDLLHYPNAVGPPLTNPPLVATLHDVSPYLCPETFPFRTAVYLRRVFYQVSRAARIVMTDTHWQAERIRHLWPELDRKLRVVYPTVSPVFRTGDLPAVPTPNASPYFLVVGTLEPRKQVELAVRAWECSNIPADLCLVGRWGWKTGSLRQCLERIGPERRISPREEAWEHKDGRMVKRLEAVPAPELADLYRHAAGLVYPSRFEGFGLPILEAMSVGCPVITHRDSAMEEVAGPAGWYFDSYSSESLAATLLELTWNRDLRHARSLLGIERSRERFSDKAFYETVRSVYREALT